MKTTLAVLLVALLVCEKSQAVPITLFQNTDTFLKRAKDIVVATCISSSVGGSEGQEDSLYAVQVEVRMVVIGMV